MTTKNKFFSIWNIVFTTLILATLGFILTRYFSTNDNWFVHKLTMKQDSLDVLVNTLWQVHAGVVTLTIAMMALIVGLNKEERYGMKTLEYVLVVGRKIYKYQDEIILSIILIFIQYWFVAYQALAGVVLLFAFNIVIICHMLYTSIKLSIYDGEVSKEIKNYILIECKKAISKENKEINNGNK
ncbi:hypothetical protein [Psychrobacillus sp. FSL H8-0487]|uniref:hypothetical protein n=1 Tax=Psychrobacillus sp. FSL H8-0487 TaxID=2921391 RepID=UPI0030FC6207